MKTIPILTMLSIILICACDRESAYEILDPSSDKEVFNTYPLSEDIDAFSTLEVSLSEKGEIHQGIQNIQVLGTTSIQQDLIFRGTEQLSQFYQDFPIPEPDTSQPQATNETAQHIIRSPKQFLRNVSTDNILCPNPKFKANMEKEISRLQQIASTHCLHLAVTFLTCNGSELEEIGVLISPGVVCQTLAISTSGPQKRNTSPFFITH